MVSQRAVHNLSLTSLHFFEVLVGETVLRKEEEIAKGANQFFELLPWEVSAVLKVHSFVEAEKFETCLFGAIVHVEE